MNKVFSLAMVFFVSVVSAQSQSIAQLQDATFHVELNKSNHYFSGSIHRTYDENEGAYVFTVMDGAVGRLNNEETNYIFDEDVQIKIPENQNGPVSKVVVLGRAKIKLSFQNVVEKKLVEPADLSLPAIFKWELRSIFTVSSHVPGKGTINRAIILDQ